MTTDAHDSAVLARLDERTGYIVKEVDAHAIGLRAVWSELNDLKSETYKTRAEVADLKGSMIQLEQRERERNGHIGDLVRETANNATDIKAVASRVVDLEGDHESRLKDAETNITALLGWRHDDGLKSETVADTKQRIARERVEFRERWHFLFEVLGFVAMLLAAGYGSATLIHTLGGLGG